MAFKTAKPASAAAMTSAIFSLGTGGTNNTLFNPFSSFCLIRRSFSFPLPTKTMRIRSSSRSNSAAFNTVNRSLAGPCAPVYITTNFSSSWCSRRNEKPPSVETNRSGSAPLGTRRAVFPLIFWIWGINPGELTMIRSACAYKNFSSQSEAWIRNLFFNTPIPTAKSGHKSRISNRNFFFCCFAITHAANAWNRLGEVPQTISIFCTFFAVFIDENMKLKKDITRGKKPLCNPPLV